MNIEQEKEVLIAKIEQELSQYKKNLIKNYTREEIIENSYETVFKEEFSSIVYGLKLDKSTIKVLLNTEKVLDKMYKKYMQKETIILDDMTDVTIEIINDINKEYNQKKREREMSLWVKYTILK